MPKAKPKPNYVRELKERVAAMEAESQGLHQRVATLQGENAQLRAQILPTAYADYPKSVYYSSYPIANGSFRNDIPQQGITAIPCEYLG